jgi:transcriptional regulator with XRE-family HTH domain
LRFDKCFSTISVATHTEVCVEELRRIRKEKKLSQAKLAALADLDPSTVNQIETGARRPNTRTLEKLAAVLGVEVSDLFPKAQSPLPLEDRPRAPGIEVGKAYFVEPEPGEELDIVTLRLYVWRELEHDDPLLQKVANLIRQERAKAKAEAG